MSQIKDQPNLVNQFNQAKAAVKETATVLQEGIKEGEKHVEALGQQAHALKGNLHNIKEEVKGISNVEDLQAKKEKITEETKQAKENAKKQAKENAKKLANEAKSLSSNMRSRFQGVKKNLTKIWPFKNNTKAQSSQ